MSRPSAKVRVWGVVPAAGVGRRMGIPKQILPYRDSTIAATVVTTLLDAGVDGVVVVTRTGLRDHLRLPDDPRIRTAINDDSDSDMLDSIRIGSASLPPVPMATRDGVLVVPADMPMLSPAASAACLSVYRADPGRIVIAACAGVRGHPIIVPQAML